MNRSQYMKALSGKLAKLPKEEFDRAMEYFEEYFEEAGPEGEADAINSLGTPEEAAEGIIRDIAIRRLDNPEKGAKKRLSTAWIVLLATLASPFALVLGCILICVLLIGGLVLLMGLLMLGMFIFAEIAAAGFGLWLMTFAPASGMVLLGGAVALLGAEWLVLLSMKGFCAKTRGFLRRMIQRKGEKRYEKWETR